MSSPAFPPRAATRALQVPSPRPASDDRCPPGSRFPLLPGVRSRIVGTPRLAHHIYESGPAGAEPVVLIHANVSSARFYEPLMMSLPEFHVIAPDLRGFGASEARIVDATRGLRDYADDLHELIEALGLERIHLVGWSMGGNVAIQYVIDHSERVLSLTLLAPGSPYGYGGTHGADGRPNYPDYAGSGAGLVHPAVVARLQARDSGCSSLFSPRSILREVYLKPSRRLARAHEDVLVEQILMMALGDRYYPGDSLPSLNWPFTAPGGYGPNNALSPKYLDQSQLVEVSHMPPILWIRGADDRVVREASLAQFALLTGLWFVPPWLNFPIGPAQPMLAQMRALLRRYAARGGVWREVVFADCGHSPHIEHQAALLAHFRPFVTHARRLVTVGESACAGAI
jgi:pimeloyl-ACP methyl ester carboxylesterase